MTIFEAIESRNLAAVKRILTNDPLQINARNGLSNTPLHEAAYSGELNIVSTLLKTGANVNGVGHLMKIPLHFPADADGRLEVAEYLVQNGSEIEKKDQLGETPLYLAARGNPPVAEMLLGHKAFLDLNSAIFLNRIDRVRQLLRDDPAMQHVLFPKELLRTALVRSKEMVQLLLEHRVKPDTPSLFDAIAFAFHSENETTIEILRLLLEAGADLHARCDTGEKVLEYVRHFTDDPNQKVIQLLKEYGAHA